MNTLTTGRQFPTLLTILDELKKAGRFNEGFHIRIENKPYMPLAIEDICDPGPDGHRVISVTRYGEQNGDLMRDPEMLFQLVETEGTMMLHPFYYRNDYVGIEEWSHCRHQGGRSLLKRNPAREGIRGALAPIDEDLAGIKVDIADLDVHELAHTHGGMEQQLEQNLVLHVATILNGSKNPFHRSSVSNCGSRRCLSTR